MARTQLNPTTLAADNAVSNLTSLLTTGGNPNAVVPGVGAGNGVTFTNIPGQTLIAFALGATACTMTVQAGMAGIGGLTASTFNVTLPVSAISCCGGYHSILNQAGGTLIALDFSSATGLVVALFLEPAVY